MRRMAVLVLGTALLIAGPAWAHTSVVQPEVKVRAVFGSVDPGDRVEIRGAVGGKSVCSTNRQVFLFRVREGRDRRLESDLTSNEGRFSFTLRPDEDQRVYVRMLVRTDIFTDDHEHTCLGDVSRRIWIDVI